MAPQRVLLFAQHAHAQGLQALDDGPVEFVELLAGGLADRGIGGQAVTECAIQRLGRQCRAKLPAAGQLLQSGDQQVDGHLDLQVFQRFVG
ncbi:hypothetical protein D3C72_2299090 [compost metagenome]